MTIKRLRVANGMTQQALAKKTGLTREFIARLESGQHDPSLSTLTKLAKGLRVKVAELVE